MSNIGEKSIKNNFESDISPGYVASSQNNKSEINISININKEENTGTSEENKINEHINSESTTKFFIIINEKETPSNNKEIQVAEEKIKSQPNNKGHTQDNMMKKFKYYFFKHIEEILNKTFKKSRIYQFNNGNIQLNSIINKINDIYKASEILELLELKLKEVLSKYDKQNKEVIKSINEAYEISLMDILNKTIKELMDIYIGKIIPEEDYYKELADCYKNFINKLAKEKVKSYVDDFVNYANNYEKIYINKSH